MSSGFGTNDKKDIDELVKKIELKIKDLRSDFTKDVTVLKNQLTVCATELKTLKELLESVSDYSHSEYERLERKSQEFEEAIADIRTKLNTIQYNEVLEGKCASGINEYPIYARYAEKDISGNPIPSYYASKSEVSGISSTLSGDYTQKIADISGASQSALSSVSALLVGRIESEAKERVNADEVLNAALENESTERKIIDDALEDRIATEETARETAIGELQVAIQEEETVRTVADENLSNEIEAEKERSIGEETRIENKLIATADSLSGLVQEETVRATTEENRLQDYIDEVVDVSTSAFEDLEQTIDSVSSTMTGLITDEKEEREQSVMAEQIRALSAEGELEEKIEDEITRASTAENVISTNLQSEITRATNQENLIKTDLDTETTNRTNEDINLQSQIDAIEATQNVVDLVGTHAELMDYDTSKLKENDKIQVLQDETKENQSTIYSFNGSGWNFVGEIGSYYTKAEVDTKLSDESQARSTKDTELDNKIVVEEARAKNAESTLQTSLDAEITRATGAETSLQTSITNETTARESAISDLQETITNEIETKINELSGTVETGFERLDTVDTQLSSNIDYVSGFVPSLSQETDYLKVSLEQNGETIYGGMIGKHNLVPENSGKLLKINDTGTGLELVKYISGLSYVEKTIPELDESQITINCNYNTLTNLNVIPGDVIDLTIHLPIQPKSDTVYHAMIQFKCDTGNKLANVILKYGLDSYFNVYKIPTSYLDDMIYQIVIYNDCATILPFGDTTIKKKDDGEQQWIENEYSELLHYFKELDEIKHATPVDSQELNNSIIDINIEPKLAIVNENEEFCNSIIDINIEPKLAIVNENGEFANPIIDINIEPKLGICENNFNLTNSIIEIEDVEEEINGD